MYPIRQMRILRKKYKIPLEELAEAAKVSPQRISHIELTLEISTPYQLELIREAFFIVAEKRNNKKLLKDIFRYETILLDFTGEYDV